ncbi:MAG TPA: hypothetical protein VLJ68_12045, partial [Chitinophagaceae bacterium]|nr:hypothetical protein [Chitinophagaceae bacterium]
MGKKLIIVFVLLLASTPSFCWGFYAHKKINYLAIFLLPPEMMVLYKPYADFLTEHAVDPDKRRYAIKEEAVRHFIDLDRWEDFPQKRLPAKYLDALVQYGNLVSDHAG